MVQNLKELRALLKLCREQGVLEIKVGEVSLKLGDLPVSDAAKGVGSPADDALQDKYANFPDGMLTPEQLIFYSSGGAPEEDPALKGEQ